MPSCNVSIVIPTFNGVDYLTECLKSLAQQTERSFEILVVDNGSQQPVSTALKDQFPGVRWIRLQRNLGFAGGCNAGAAAAEGRWLIFLNDDTEPDSQWLKELMKVVEEHPDFGACSSKIRVLGDPSRLDCIGSYLTACGFLKHVGLLEADQGQYDHLTELFSPKGVAFAIRRDLFEKCGGFDACYFAYFEETDLFWRLWLRGVTVGFAARSIVYHKIGGTASRTTFTFVDYLSFRNRIRTLLKNAGAATLCWMLPFHLVCCLFLAGLCFLQPARRRSGAAILRAIGWNLKHLQETWGARHEVQKERAVSDRALWERFLKPIPVADFVQYTQWLVWSRERLRSRIHTGTVKTVT